MTTIPGPAAASHTLSETVQPAFAAWSLLDIEQSIGERFESQVCTSPERLAVKSGAEAWTYRELNERANQNAHSLLERRGRASEPVAIFYEHGAPLVAAILGALKAGKFYLVLDPHDPDAQLAATLAGATPPIVLCDSYNADRARAIAGSASIVISPFHTARAPTSNPEGHVSPDALAYVFYTSGSTGAPKGVVDNHRNVLHNVLRYTNNLRITAHDRLTLLQSCAFSGSVSSLFCAVLNGAASFPFDLRRFGTGRLSNWLADEEITLYHSVPSIFRRLAPRGGKYSRIRAVRLEGDRASALDVEMFRQHFPDSCELAIGLGATETGLSCQYICGNGKPLPGEVVPIGRPVFDMKVRIVDDDGEPVADGIAGEIMVRSRYLAVGYWGRSDLTNAAFRDCGKDGREYSTGDIGRIGPDSQLEYLGRTDHRLKIGGNSVEPSVVEQALIRTGLVREAVVGSRENSRGEPQLIAWVVADGEPPPASMLRRILHQNVASWMVPSEIAFLESMPVSANGKIDRNQLVIPRRHAMGTKRELTEPRTDLERAITRVWREALDVDDFGVHDDFVNLGGDSLAAVRIAVDIEERLGMRLAPSDILVATTIAELARLLQNSKAPRDSSVVCLQPEGDESPLFFVHPATGDVLFYQELAAELGTRRPFYALRAAPWHRNEPQSLSVQNMAARYIRDIRAIQPEGAYNLGGYCFGAHVAQEMARQLEAEGETVSALFVLDCDGEERCLRSPADAVTIHFRRLARLRGTSAVKYVWERVRFRIERGRVLTIMHVARLFRLRAGWASAILSREELRAVHAQASSRHAAKAWGGRITYIHPYDRTYADPSSYWLTTTTGGLVIVDVPAPHAELFHRPHVIEVAKAINSALSTKASLLPDARQGVAEHLKGELDFAERR